jgi:hypothetical protein
VAHYGLSPYWGAPPEVGVPPQGDAGQGARRMTEGTEGSLLLSGGEIDGYELDAQGETVGTVRDVLIDLDTWKITSLMADLGGIFTRDAATVATGPVTGIDRPYVPPFA